MGYKRDETRKLILTKLYENGNKYILYIFTAYK